MENVTTNSPTINAYELSLILDKFKNSKGELNAPLIANVSRELCQFGDYHSGIIQIMNVVIEQYNKERDEKQAEIILQRARAFRGLNSI